MSDQLDIFARSHTRTTDPVTSLRSAKIAAVRAGSNKHKILKVLEWAGSSGALTFEEVARLAGISEGNAWKRLADLKTEKRVRVVDESGTTRNDAPCSRYRITDFGLSTVGGEGS